MFLLEIQLGLDVIEQNYDYPNFVFERVFSNRANRQMKLLFNFVCTVYMFSFEYNYFDWLRMQNGTVIL